MREISFRAWDTVTNTMYYNPFNGKLGGLNDILSNTGNWLYMQYTGIKDLNGVKIYEDDIVKWGQECLDGYRIIQPGSGVVKWNDDWLRYDIGINWQTFEKYRGTLEILRNVRYTVKVIGNAYQNPELLR